VKIFHVCVTRLEVLPNPGQHLRQGDHGAGHEECRDEVVHHNGRVHGWRSALSRVLLFLTRRLARAIDEVDSSAGRAPQRDVCQAIVGGRVIVEPRPHILARGRALVEYGRYKPIIARRAVGRTEPGVGVSSATAVISGAVQVIQRRVYDGRQYGGR
jgi:hypothetical protein